jgi:hypothetical protein
MMAGINPSMSSQLAGLGGPGGMFKMPAAP